MATPPDCPSLKPQRDYLGSLGFAWQLEGNRRWYAGGTIAGRIARKRMYFGSGGWMPVCGYWEGPSFATPEAAIVYAELNNWGQT